jgi:hypothetical protein
MKVIHYSIIALYNHDQQNMPLKLVAVNSEGTENGTENPS